MLKDKNNFSGKCIKFTILIWIIAILMISWFAMFLALIIFILLYLSMNENNTLNYDKVLEFFWVIDCIWFLFSKGKNSSQNSYKNNIQKKLDKLKLEEKLEKQKELKKLENSIEFLKDEKINKKNSLDSWNIYSKNNNSFEWWKSIWDDYESVLDNFNKK